ncbi:uncharacterized protein BX664DRAFT_340774 [Halteromyces radiatus]|uniref:uncharacterized protein n=1 Tax=Halteromyces radiatus TaxID=101107 RepID=UPI00221E3935|nr:uncharacterized protein BX664DRAFT_340774 [Halteromyces radiatus]KAI8081589.1 hypothetical protein BX664DRAFT_340774 [Halteromyces radiatus]
MNTSKSIYRICLDGKCYCDFRISVTGCVDENVMKLNYYITLGITAPVILFGLFLLFKRVCIQGHRFIDKRSALGCLRPHPMDCLLLFCLIFNILRTLDNILLVTDGANHPILRSFFWEFSWEFLYAGFVLYVLGVAQTLRDSHKAVSTGWLPSAKTIDRLITTLLVSVVVTNETCTFVAGVYGESNIPLATSFILALYYLWFIYCAILAVGILYCGARLIFILETHLENFSMPQHRINSIKTGIIKIKAMVGVGFFGSIIYGVSMLLFAALRQGILSTEGGGLTLSLIWNLTGPIATAVVEITMIFSANPQHMSNFLGLKASSDNANNNSSSNTDDFTNKSTDAFVFTDTSAISQHTATDDFWQTRPVSLKDTEQLQLEYQNAIEHLRTQGPNNSSTKAIT